MNHPYFRAAHKAKQDLDTIQRIRRSSDAPVDGLVQLLVLHPLYRNLWRRFRVVEGTYTAEIVGAHVDGGRLYVAFQREGRYVGSISYEIRDGVAEPAIHELLAAAIGVQATEGGTFDSDDLIGKTVSLTATDEWFQFNKVQR